MMDGNIDIKGRIGVSISRSRETEDKLDIKQNMKHEKIKETGYINKRQGAIDIHIDIPHDLQLSEQMKTELCNAFEKVMSRYIRGK